MTLRTQYILALKKGFLTLLIVHIIYAILDQLLSSALDKTLLDTNGSQTFALIVFGSFSMLLNLGLTTLLSFYSFFLLAQVGGQYSSPFYSFFTQKLESFFIENLRSWGRIFLYSLCLILPGIRKALQLSMVPLVTLFSESYQSGEIDALEESQKITRGQLLRVMGIFFIFYVIFPLFMSIAFDEYRIFWETPLSAFLLVVGELVIALFLNTWLFRFYFKTQISLRN